jgi:hypothetical protein
MSYENPERESALDNESRETLNVRLDKGEDILERAWCPPVLAEEDRYSAGSDAVSYILTALFGPAGFYQYDAAQDESTPRPVMHSDRYGEAVEFVARALESWRGDAEDYTVPENRELHIRSLENEFMNLHGEGARAEEIAEEIAKLKEKGQA